MFIFKAKKDGGGRGRIRHDQDAGRPSVDGAADFESGYAVARPVTGPL